MASKGIQSNSSSQMICKYDVFVSFRGEDTRNGFTDHLFAALQRKGIITFRDDQKLKKGETIAPELLQAIEGSRILIVVFSKNYASSTWCLQELTKIVDCIEVPGQSVLPVFYDVSPSEVRKQSGNFGKAFVEHEERFKEDLEMVQRWRRALTQVTNLAGWDVQNKLQHEQIENIVKMVATILAHKISSFANDLVGIDSPLEQLANLLVLGSNDVHVVGICGMGGMGKSTLATVLYDRICHQYDACCFIDDVSKFYGDHGAMYVLKQFLRQALNEENLEICNLYEATCSIRARLRHLKALIVLDNVDKVEQLEKLAVTRECLGAGSRIIIISRDKHILNWYGVDGVYNAQLLNWDYSLQLFCKKAFKCNDIMRDYKELTYDALNYANGHPLTIKVLGSFLFGRDVSEWRSALVRLRENSSKDIMDVLRISFDGLDEIEKKIFLDIACFFNGDSEQYVKEVLNCCGFQPDIGLRVLEDKSLITILAPRIYMHDLLQELGKRIAQENSPEEPGKWNRLWLFQDFHKVMLENKETKNIEAIVLEIEREEEISTVEALSKMSCLRLLILKNVKFSGSLNYLFSELRYFQWYKCPFMDFSSSFQANKLVELSLPYNSMKQLWKGIKYLPNLRIMDLRHSENLMKMPNFNGVQNLERLDLEECTKLVQIHPSISLLGKLSFLNLKNCKNLVSIPNILGLSCLEYLNLSGCSKAFNKQLLDKPRHAGHLKRPDIRETAMQSQSTYSIFESLMLPFHFFNSRTHKHAANCLLPSLPSFRCLRDLDLSFCNLHQIPDAIGWLHELVTLSLGGNNFVRLPCSLKELSKLKHLNLEHCKQLKYLPALPLPTVLPVRRESSFYDHFLSLHIFNCPKLAEMNNCCSMAFSWMAHVLQVFHQSSITIGRINIVIPGSQIPRWFNNQCVGSSIRVDPSPILHDNNWIGIACCIVFVVLDGPTNFHEHWRTYIWCRFYRNKQCNKASIIQIDPVKDLVMVDLGHQWLLYLTRENFLDYIHHNDQITEEKHDLDGIEMVAKISQPLGLHIEVKNCGYRWVFKQDLEQLSSTMMHGVSSNNIQILDDLGIGVPVLYSEATNSSVESPKFLTMD